MSESNLLMQERGRPTKIHLQDTVEEMHKFNAIRKLKVTVAPLNWLIDWFVCQSLWLYWEVSTCHENHGIPAVADGSHISCCSYWFLDNSLTSYKIEVHHCRLWCICMCEIS